MLLSDIREGTILNDKYLVGGKLGEGGFAVVYRARDLELGREVALKLFKLSTLGSELDQTRFAREARTVAQLKHENIVTVYSLDLLADGSPLIVMEYLSGRSLFSYLQEKGLLSYESCQPIFLQICQALSYAHRQGVVHRDLSCSNIFLLDGPELSVKVIDFGLAKLLDKDGSEKMTFKITRTGTVVGNPAYMSPEQCRGDRLDARSDIYSLGCMLYECLCGKVPFSDSNPIAVLTQHQAEYPAEPQFTWNNKELQEKYKTIVLKCLQKDRDHRFQSADDILSLLQEDGAAASAAHLPKLHSWGGVQPWKSKGRLVLGSLAAAILVLVMAFACSSSAAGFLASMLIKLHNPLFVGMEESLYGRLKSCSPPAAIALCEDILASGGSRLPYSKRLNYSLDLAELYLASGQRQKIVELLRQALQESNAAPAIDRDALARAEKLINCATLEQAPSEDELLLRAVLLDRAVAAGAGSRTLVNSAVEVLLSRYEKLENKAGRTAAYLPQLCRSLTRAFKSAPISLTLKTNIQAIPASVTCPKEGAALFQAILDNRGFDEHLKGPIRVSLLQCLSRFDAIQAIKKAQEFIPEADEVDKVVMLAFLSQAEASNRDFKNALAHIQSAIRLQERLRQDFTEVYKLESIVDILDLIRQEADLYAYLGDKKCVRNLCEKAVALLPDAEQMHVKIHRTGMDFSAIPVQGVRLGEAWGTHANYYEIFRLCGNFEQIDLLKGVLKNYLLMLKCYPDNPYMRVRDPAAVSRWYSQLGANASWFRARLSKHKDDAELRALLQESLQLLEASLRKSPS